MRSCWQTETSSHGWRMAYSRSSIQEMTWVRWGPLLTGEDTFGSVRTPNLFQATCLTEDTTEQQGGPKRKLRTKICLCLNHFNDGCLVVIWEDLLLSDSEFDWRWKQVSEKVTFYSINLGSMAFWWPLKHCVPLMHFLVCGCTLQHRGEITEYATRHCLKNCLVLHWTVCVISVQFGRIHKCPKMLPSSLI